MVYVWVMQNLVVGVSSTQICDDDFYPSREGVGDGEREP